MASARPNPEMKNHILETYHNLNMAIPLRFNALRDSLCALPAIPQGKRPSLEIGSAFTNVAKSLFTAVLTHSYLSIRQKKRIINLFN